MLQTLVLKLKFHLSWIYGCILLKLKRYDKASKIYESILIQLPPIQSDIGFLSLSQLYRCLVCLTHINLKLGIVERAELNFQQLLFVVDNMFTKCEAGPKLQRFVFYKLLPLSLELFIVSGEGRDKTYVSHLLNWIRDDCSQRITAREFLREMADILEERGHTNKAKEIRDKVHEVLKNSPAFLF